MPGQGTQIFLTHDWGHDELGRDNHERVKRVHSRLRAHGVASWFDEEEMRGDINQKVAMQRERSLLTTYCSESTISS